MNYRNVFSETVLLFGRSKLLWIFGGLSIVADFIYRVSTYSIGKHSATCFLYPLALIAIYFSFLTKVGLIYSSNQIISNQIPTFSEAWEFCKTKVKGILWLYFLSIPLVMFLVFIPELVRLSEISDILTWFIEMLANSFLTSLFVLSICAITINNLESGMALWTGLLIVLNNFLHIIALNIIFLAFQILLIWATGNSIICIIVFVPFTVTMTLAYREFITKNSYPALSNTQPTA